MKTVLWLHELYSLSILLIKKNLPFTGTFSVVTGMRKPNIIMSHFLNNYFMLFSLTNRKENEREREKEILSYNNFKDWDKKIKPFHFGVNQNDILERMR